VYTMILLLYLQQGLDVTLDRASLRGEFHKQADCEAAAGKLRGPLPIPRTHDAAWQDVMCILVAGNVHVNPGEPLDLARALEEQAPLRCQADGAWTRLVELCRPLPPVPPASGR
jgi:hypothetical protein